jgi:hypothetical protein
MKLSNEEKRVKIAEIDHWVKITSPNISGGVSVSFRRGRHHVGVHNLPDYTGDLNEIHSAIMSQSDLFRKAMRLYLWEGTSQMSAHFATAEEMADAFLATHEHLSKNK